jgi:putative ABC transport system ATP-binding protein
MTTRPFLEALGVSKAHGHGLGVVHAVVDVSLTLERASLTAIVGPSGSGKSTLLHCLSGIAAPDTGSVLLEGTDLVALGDADRSRVRRTRMSFVFQRGNLAPALTVAENVSTGLVLRRAGRDEIRAKVAEALDRCGLADRASAYPAELSGGQQQRAALARALAPSPDLLWADEPTGALDRAAARDLLGLLKDAAAAGTSVVVATHDGEVAAAAQQEVRLQDGRRLS